MDACLFTDAEWNKLPPLLAALPSDPFAALVLADYLEELPDDRRRQQGALLRLVYTLTRGVHVEARVNLERQMNDLLRSGVQAIGPYRRVDLGAGVGLVFAWVPPGTFLMGSPDEEEGRAEDGRWERGLEPNEGPRHTVTLTRGFWIGTTPVTQLQFARVTGGNPSWCAPRGPDVPSENRDLPVQEVTWLAANGFLLELSKRVGGRFRLPTEAEWEYACRAGTTTRFWSGDAEADLARVGWYVGNQSRDGSHPMRPVGHGANPHGLCDMHGNVWEWCADRFDETYYARSPRSDPRCRRGYGKQRVVRGGDAWDEAAACRSAARASCTEDCSHNDIGFRVVADKLDAIFMTNDAIPGAATDPAS